MKLKHSVVSMLGRLRKSIRLNTSKAEVVAKKKAEAAAAAAEAEAAPAEEATEAAAE